VAPFSSFGALTIFLHGSSFELQSCLQRYVQNSTCRVLCPSERAVSGIVLVRRIRLPIQPMRGPVEPKRVSISWRSLLLLALKLAKSSKLFLALLSLLAWSVMLSWQTAVVFMFGLCFHEYGHVWAMRRCGIPTKGFYLIPFVGGVCAPDRPFELREEEAYVAAMGPVFGLAAAPLCLVLGYFVTGSLGRAVDATSFMVIVNLFNLLPIVPLDGGRILRAVTSSLNRTAGIVLILLGCGLAGYLAWRLPAPILAFIMFIGLLEAWTERNRGGSIAAMSRGRAVAWIGAYLLLCAAAMVLLVIGAAIKGDGSLLHVLGSL
jgi:putative peptide zinc metalloprotease protein